MVLTVKILTIKTNSYTERFIKLVVFNFFLTYFDDTTYKTEALSFL